MTYGALAAELEREGLALANLASLPHISVAGAIATATHGSGDRNGNLATAVAALELVTSGGERVTVSRGDPGFEGHVVSLGALGAVTRIALDVEPAYDVRQDVFEGLAWQALLSNLDEIFASAYAVSVFTRWGEAVDQVWLKSRVADHVPRDELFGARPATVDRHPIIGNDPAYATPQLGRPGPWSERLAHFRLSFTPSNGEEIQSEYHVPRRHAAAAIEALRGVAAAVRDLVLVTELRTVAADRAVAEPAVRPGHARDPLHVAPRPRGRRRARSGRRGRARPVRAAPPLGQGVPAGRRRARRPLRAPGRLRAARRAARPARRVPQRLAGRARRPTTSCARAGGRSRPGGSSGPRRRPPRSA